MTTEEPLCPNVFSLAPEPPAVEPAKYPGAELMQNWRAGAEFNGLNEHAIGRHLIRKACDWQREQDALICMEWRAGCDNRSMQAEGWAAAECASAIRAPSQHKDLKA